MKAIVLAAGKGERLRGVVDAIPKPMIEVRGRPILEHNIIWLRDYGIKDIYINLHHMPDTITHHLGNGSSWGVKITYSYEAELLGTSGAVKRIVSIFWKKFDRNERFLVIYGDNMFNYDLDKVLNFDLEHHDGIGTIAVYRKEGDLSQSGIVILDDTNRIIKFIEKPARVNVFKEKSVFVNSGVYVLGKKIVDYIPGDRYSDFGTDIFPKVISAGECLYGIVIEAEPICVDTPELYLEATKKKGGKNDYHTHTF